jgi:hypothetical protein
MVRAGISLPVLQHLMGHPQIHTTMLYVQLAPPGRLARVCPRRRQPRAFDHSADAMSQPRHNLEQIFETQVQNLALTLQPFTVVKYEYVTHRFVGYLRATFPGFRRLSQLRRGPHMLSWFRWLCELRPPIGNHQCEQRLLCLRRLLDDLAAQRD